MPPIRDSRRGFLRRSTAAVVGASLAPVPRLAGAAESPADRPVFATIGLRNQGWTITEKSFKYADFAALADVDAGVLADNVAKVDMTLANKIREHVFDKMSSPKLYDQCFPKRDNDKEVEEEEMKVDETPEENVDRATPGETFMSELAGILPRAGVLFAEILRKLFDNTYEKAVNALASENDMAAKIMSGDELQDLTRDLNEMMRAIHGA